MTLDAVATGDALPALAIEIDRLLITAGAIASQDFEDVHRDPGAAVRRGSPDVFISINTSNGLLDRYVTDWAGPEARIASVALRLGVPLYPSDTLTLSGEVLDTSDGMVSVRVVGANARGPHVTATLKLRRHEGSAA